MVNDFIVAAAGGVWPETPVVKAEIQTLIIPEIGGSSYVRVLSTTETLSTTEGTDFEISLSVISVVLGVSVVKMH